MAEVLASYRLELLGPPPAEQTQYQPNVTVRAVGLAPAFLHETQENINSLLPEGYSVRIRPANPGSESWQGRGARHS